MDIAAEKVQSPTNDWIDITNNFGILSEDYYLFKDELEIAMNLLKDGKVDEVIQSLRSLIVRFPNDLLLLDRLAHAYEYMEDKGFAHQIIYDNYQRFPYSLLARTRYARLCLQKQSIVEAAKAVDYVFDIITLYPERKMFHIYEFSIFQSFAVRYFCALKDYNRAMDCIGVLYQLKKELFLSTIKELNLFVLLDILENHLDYNNIANVLLRFKGKSEDCVCDEDCDEDCECECHEDEEELDEDDEDEEWECDCGDEECDCDEDCEGECECECHCHEED